MDENADVRAHIIAVKAVLDRVEAKVLTCDATRYEVTHLTKEIESLKDEVRQILKTLHYGEGVGVASITQQLMIIDLTLVEIKETQSSIAKNAGNRRRDKIAMIVALIGSLGLILREVITHLLEAPPT